MRKVNREVFLCWGLFIRFLVCVTIISGYKLNFILFKSGFFAQTIRRRTDRKIKRQNYRRKGRQINLQKDRQKF